MGIIYMATNMINDKIYIGKTTKTLNYRISCHLSSAKSNKPSSMCPYFYKAIVKYGREAFKWRVIEDDIPKSDLDAAEIFWIAHFRKIGACLYNIADGGSGGGKLSPEGAARISAAARGNKYALGNHTGPRFMPGFKHTEEAKAKISAAGKGNKYNLGRKQSDEERAMRSQALKGKRVGFRHTEETKAVIRLKRKIQPEPRIKTYNIILRSPNGTEYGPITNMKAFAQEHGLQTSCLCELVSGKRPMHKGWVCFIPS